MLRALAWKEWREQRPNVIAGLGLAAMLPFFVLAGGVMSSTGISARTLADSVPVLFAILLWPLFALAAGASTFANERAGQTLGFLASRPIARRHVWTVKVALAGVATLVVIVGSAGVGWVLQRFAARPLGTFISLDVFASTLGPPMAAAIGPAALYLTFASAVFFSTRGSRALTAAAGALVAALFMLAVIVFVWPLLALVGDLQAVWIGTETAIAATLLLVLSLRRFTRLDTSAPSSLRQTAGALAAVLAVTLMLGLTPVVYADMWADIDNGSSRRLAIYPGADVLVVEAGGYPSTLGSLWALGTRVPEARRLTGGLAFQSFAAPDGRSIYYFTRRGPLGLAKRAIDLRVVNIDGTGDRLVVADVAPARESLYLRGIIRTSFAGALFSPDGSRLVIPQGYWGWRPILIGRDGEVEYLAGVDERESVEALAWTADGSQLLVELSRFVGDNGRRSTLARYDLATQSTEPILEAGGLDDWNYLYAGFPGGQAAPAASGKLPFRVIEDRTGSYDATLALLDVATNEVETLARYECGTPSAAVSGDGRTLVYRTYRGCAEEEDGGVIGVDPLLHVRDLQTGVEREPIAFAGTVAVYRVSPDGARVLIAARDRPESRSFYEVVDLADGTRLALDTRRYVDGVRRGPSTSPQWLDDERLMVRYDRRFGRSQPRVFVHVEIVDATTGDTLVRYAPGEAIQ